MISDISIQDSAGYFLDILRYSRKGKLKIYIGLAAGVGKTYRMLQEAHMLLNNGINVIMGFIETHGRIETAQLMEGLPRLTRKEIFYKGKQLYEFDIDAALITKPDVILIDELAHTNLPGSRNEKRWQDVIELMDAGVNVITTLNIQHIESIREEVENITGIAITERVPDRIISKAEEVVNVDLTIEELINRLKTGKIYEKSKIDIALNNFFQEDKLLQLRDLALKEVSHQVAAKIHNIIAPLGREKINSIITAISTNSDSASRLIRRSARLANIYNTNWYVVYIKTQNEALEKIDSSAQRLLINNFKLAAELGAEVVQVTSDNVAQCLCTIAHEKEAGMIIMGKPKFSIFNYIFKRNIFRELLELTEKLRIDILLVAGDEKNKE